MNVIDAAERGWLPDALVRVGIRRLLRQRLNREAQHDPGEQQAAKSAFVDSLRAGPIALAVDDANTQHYEVPTAFFERVLGPHLKYSCGYWPTDATTLEQSESHMLRLTCERAGIADNMRILELGCGWGSLCLWIARNYPGCRITAVSNSATQRQFITARCRQEGLDNLRVVTANVAEFAPQQVFDRIVSVEMFEHLRNYQIMLARVADWLTPTGELFLHVFCHREAAYAFETNGADNWMGRHFFTGGIMPARDLFFYFQDDMVVGDHWCVSGMHYARTCAAWLANVDRQRTALSELLSAGEDANTGRLRLQRYRMFFMACAELFRYSQGNEWFVAHYLLRCRR